MLNVRVVDFGELVLLFLGNKSALDGSVPLIAAFQLENSPKLFLSLFDVVERCPLMHTMLANATIPREHDIQLTI